MNRSQIRHLNRGQARAAFYDDNKTAFPADSPGERVFTAMKTVIADIQALAAQKDSGAYSQAIEVKDLNFDALKKMMRKMRRAAEDIGEEIEGYEELFRTPVGQSEEAWLAKARTFHANSEAEEARFFDYDLLPTFRADLMNIITAMETASVTADISEQERGGATGALVVKFRELGRLGRRADRIVRNKFDGDAEKLAAWEIASELVDAPQVKEEPVNQ